MVLDRHPGLDASVAVHTSGPVAALLEGSDTRPARRRVAGDGRLSIAMESDICRILTVNGGSSSIKFALFDAGEPPHRVLRGGIERIGRSDATFAVAGVDRAEDVSRSLTAPDHAAAVAALMAWVEQCAGREPLTAVGHRVVHGGPHYSRHAGSPRACAARRPGT